MPLAAQYCSTINQTLEKHGMTMQSKDTTLRYPEKATDAIKSGSKAQEANELQTWCSSNTNT